MVLAKRLLNYHCSGLSSGQVVEAAAAASAQLRRPQSSPTCTSQPSPPPPDPDQIFLNAPQLYNQSAPRSSSWGGQRTPFARGGTKVKSAQKRGKASSVFLPWRLCRTFFFGAPLPPATCRTQQQCAAPAPALPKKTWGQFAPQKQGGKKPKKDTTVTPHKRARQRSAG